MKMMKIELIQMIRMANTKVMREQGKGENYETKTMGITYMR